MQPNEEGLGDTSIASDHTFAAGKAYHAPGDALKIWDMTSGWYRTLVAVVVKTTKSAEILHAAEELAHRDGFAPATHFTDTCPANSDLWATILPTSVLRLGVFQDAARSLAFGE